MNTAASRTKAQDISWMLGNAGQCIRTIAPSEVDTEIEVLCTYTWYSRGSQYSPTIHVPGLPRKWAPLAVKVELPPDKGQSMVDAHRYWTPNRQFEPIFQALAIMNPNTRFNNVDIIINRNSMTKLLKFVSLKPNDPFHLDLHLVNNTLLVGRKEKYPKDVAYGWGHSFEKHFTTEQDPDADPYHRVVRYQFGDLNLVIRHEVDAFHEKAPPTLQSFERFNGIDKPENPDAPSRLPIVHSKGTFVFERGIRIPQHQIAELKSSDRGAAAICQCWFGRTQNLCVAKHTRGMFTEANMEDVWGKCVEWEKEEQNNLRRLAGLLGQIREIMKSTKTGRGILVRKEKEAPIQVYEGRPGMNDVLPPEVTNLFWDSQAGGENGERDIGMGGC